MTTFIRKEFHVEEPDKVRTVRMDQPAPRPQMPDAGPVFLVGLPGSGKSAVAQRLAPILGLPVLALKPTASAEEIRALAAQGPALAEVPHKLLADAAARQALHETGRVLYLMADVAVLARRLAKAPEDEERLRESLGRLRGAYEALFMQTLHLLVPAEGPLDEVLALAQERLRF